MGRERLRLHRGASASGAVGERVVGEREAPDIRVLSRAQGGVGHPRDALVLQRLVGNAATARLLSDAADAIVQRAKDGDERAHKQRRVARARAVIPGLNDKVKRPVKDHIFNGKPFVGAASPAAPQGLHAYTNGGLPAGLHQVARAGSEGRVHTLRWGYTGNAAVKESTMFPTWMPASHVNALMALNYPEVAEGGLTAKETAAKSAITTYVSRGLTITLAKSGDTIYPTL